MEEKKTKRFSLPNEITQKIWGVFAILLAIIVTLSFFNQAGSMGRFFMKSVSFLIGEIIFIIPLIFILAGLIFLVSKRKSDSSKEKQNIFWPVVLSILILTSGLTGIVNSFDPIAKKGGWLGYILSWPILKFFGFWATQIIFLALIVVGLLIFYYFLRSCFGSPKTKEDVSSVDINDEVPKSSIVKKFFAPKFKVKEVPADETGYGQKATQEKATESFKIEAKPMTGIKASSYLPPPIELLESEHGTPNSGDTKLNSAIIKKTLESFDINVTMSEINVGPTVTQYTLKPAEGVKLSKITNLSNDLSLALASHPIRIEAPVPGRSLVGIEIPNKVRAQVKLRNLIEDKEFEKFSSNLILALGRDVSGSPVYADLARMPHLLVAGSTGTGKTIFLNSLIQSLLYQPSIGTRSSSPENLRLILIDPKRVEFSVYSNLPHLLCPIIYNATQALNALKWLVKEMERRFDLLSESKTRNVYSYNEKAFKNGTPPLPFIVLIIDELADLMMAKGREIETEIVRLAQMARAAGIHLVVATQRPSVEVITGLIKANITSRITFQVASQVDSRTVLDASGAEKLLGFGDMLYISANITKPKRVQGSYISEKEVKKIISHIVLEEEKRENKTEAESDLVEEIERINDGREEKSNETYGDEDPLFEEAKRVVIEANKASASLLQRRLRVGYARAARLIDILEEKGLVGPADGAKPREVYAVAETQTFREQEPPEISEAPKEQEQEEQQEQRNDEDDEDEQGWKKI
ncbi:MAG: DNA translocase FtsK 4TM domain-containing protein [Patescibacteria group bacterium]|nr:DNA translocase FtsK 4TM domain-containing protein [Patescibacteria group bacterium]